MECRIGITQNPEERLEHWQKEYPTLIGWDILAECATKLEAQDVCMQYARERECEICPEDFSPKVGAWFVYCFRFGEVVMEIELRDAEGEVCTVKSLQQLKKFLEDEVEFWMKQQDQVSKSEHPEMHAYLNCGPRLEKYIKAIDQFIVDSPTSNEDEFVQHAKRLTTNITAAIASRWIWSKRPYVPKYIMCNLHYGPEAADAFADYILHRPISVPDQARFFGTMQGYEFARHDEDLDSRLNGERQSLDRLRKQFQGEIARFQTQGNTCTDMFKTWEAKVREQTDAMHREIKYEGENQIRQQSEHFKKTMKEQENRMEEWGKRMHDLKCLYEEKLRLRKPAEYWNSTGKKYMWQGIGWLALVGAISVIGLWWLADYFGSWLRGAEVALSLHTMQGAVIFASLMAVFVFAVRTLSRLTFSSFHLMRDAQEREQLTYLYLALSEEDSSVKESRDIILRALFSRSQTGLLTNEHGPTMPATDWVQPDK